MAFRAKLLGLLLIAVGLTPLLADGAAGQTLLSGPRPPAVVDVRLGDHGATTRFVLEMTTASEFRLTTLDEPYRIVLDFPALEWETSSSAPSVGLIAEHRHEKVGDGTLRVTLSLKRPARVADMFYLPATAARPYRFVLDLGPADPSDFLLTAVRSPAVLRRPDEGPASPAPAADAQVETLAQDSTAAPATAFVAAVPAGLSVPLPGRRPSPPVVRVVAIDPGHGGIDPGAIGPSGTQEKDITLAVARKLRATLEARGRYRVVLTRDSDVYLRLRDRVALARAAGADLFISIHADSIDDPQVRGASVYTLSDVASDEEAALLAARENRADALAGVALDPEDDIMASILIDLAQRASQNESRIVAQLVVDNLAVRTPLVRNTHRQAGFAVLKAPDVPSVLVELGYLSNHVDERTLLSSGHREAMAAAIARAIDQYFARHQTLTNS
ncbi:MAG: N-acetylmuramoyl-L-alanine amidase [Inquilinaceae bacterium]